MKYANTFDIAINAIVDDRETFRRLVQEIGPIAQKEFNRLCWKLYGTGRTESDEQKEIAQ